MSEPVEVLAQNRRTDGRREWSSVGAWLQPGQSIAILSADDPRLAREAPPGSTTVADNVRKVPPPFGIDLKTVPRVPPRLFPDGDDD
jgi:hypothetical protein